MNGEEEAGILSARRLWALNVARIGGVDICLTRPSPSTPPSPRDIPASIWPHPSLARYRSHVTDSLAPALGRVRLAKLSPQAIQALYAAKLEEGYAPGTVRQMHAVLRRALGQAARLGLLPRNVATLGKV